MQLFKTILFAVAIACAAGAACAGNAAPASHPPIGDLRSGPPCLPLEQKWFVVFEAAAPDHIIRSHRFVCVKGVIDTEAKVVDLENKLVAKLNAEPDSKGITDIVILNFQPLKG